MKRIAIALIALMSAGCTSEFSAQPAGFDPEYGDSGIYAGTCPSYAVYGDWFTCENATIVATKEFVGAVPTDAAPNDEPMSAAGAVFAVTTIDGATQDELNVRFEPGEAICVCARGTTCASGLTAPNSAICR